MSEEFDLVQATLQPTDIFFDKCTFVRTADPVLQDGKINYQFNFERSITRINNQNYRVSLQCNISTEEKEVEMHVRVVGLFCVNAEDEKLKNALISKNTMSILFPYVRSQLTLLTAQSGLPSVVLPVVNIAEMFTEASLPEDEKL